MIIPPTFVRQSRRNLSSYKIRTVARRNTRWTCGIRHQSTRAGTSRQSAQPQDRADPPGDSSAQCRIHFLLSLGILALVVLAVGVVRLSQNLSHQGTELKQVNKSVREATRAPQLTPDSLVAALESADIAQLTRFEQAGFTVAEFGNALSKRKTGAPQTVARGFFERSRRSQAAIDWLAAMLHKGLDPNLLVDDNERGPHGLLRDAFQAGNTGAVLGLLNAGASPHPLQPIWMSPYSVPGFLFPYAFLDQDSRFSDSDRRTLAEAMQRAVAVIIRYTPGKPNPKNETDQLAAVERLFEDAPKTLQMPLVETPPDSHAHVSPIAENAARLTGFDWPALVRQIPAPNRAPKNKKRWRRAR